jgi:hypothetical protein
MSTVRLRKFSGTWLLAFCVAAGASACVIEADGGDGDGGAGAAGAVSPGGGSGGAAGRGGAGGAGGAPGGGAGGGGAGGAVTSACGALTGPAEAEPNGDNPTATAYAFGDSVQGCLETATDVDAFRFAVPDDGTGGGVLVAFTGVGEGSLQARVFVEGDNGALVEPYEANRGGNLTAYFAAAPGRTYYVQVSSFAGERFGYTMKATYAPVADAFEPNDGREAATPIGLNMPYSAYYFAGYAGAAAPGEDRLQDFFAVDLAAGAATVALTNAPATFRADVRVFDPAGEQVASAYTTTPGANVTVNVNATAGGKYAIAVRHFSVAPEYAGKADALPEHFTKPYQLLVTQP